MKALTLPSGTAGKSLLTLASLVLLLGLVTGQAAAATVSGTVTLGTGISDPKLMVVATTAAPNYCFLKQGQPTSTSTPGGTYSFSLPAEAECSDGTKPLLVVGSQILVFVHKSDPQIVSAPNDSIEKSFTYTGTSQEIKSPDADFSLVKGAPLEGNVADLRTGSAVGVANVTVFATNGPNQYKFLGQTLTLGQNCQITFTCGDYTLYAAAGQQVELAVDTQDPDFVADFPDGIVDPPFIRDILLADSQGCSGSPVALEDVKWCQLFFDIVKAITISGTVTDAGTGFPIGGAQVDAFFVEVMNNQEVWTWLAETFTDDTSTASRGSYTVRVLSHLGSVRLTVNKTGYFEGIEDRTWDPLDPLTPTGLTGVDIALVPRFVTVTVHVTDTSSPPQPIAWASVTVGGTFLGNTNNSGDFPFQVASNSSVTIQVSKTGFLSASQTVSVGVRDLTVPFPLMPIPTTDTVRITKAVWKAGTLTVFATSSVSGPENPLTARVVKSSVNFDRTYFMNYSAKRKQYELKVSVSTNLVGGTVTVTSSLNSTGVMATITSK